MIIQTFFQNIHLSIFVLGTLYLYIFIFFFTGCKKACVTMSLRVIRKVHVNLLILLVTINIIFFMFVFLQSKFALMSLQIDTQLDLQGDLIQLAHVFETPSSPKPKSTLDPVMMKKIQLMKNDLNDTSLTNQVNFPGNRIGKYIMLNRGLCKDAAMIDIIIIVHTATKNLDKRQRIRDSFAKASNFYPFQVRVAFLLGLTENKTLERVLWFEHTRYNDTIMGDFKDDYHNLTLKGVMGYRWVSQHCPNSRFVLKIDDDVLINMYKLLYTFLNHMSGKKKSIFCNMWHKDTMPILRTGKWRVEPHVFANKTTFPYEYCSGFVVLMTTDLMGPLSDAANTTPFFWIDDIYLFGMLPSVVGGVTYYNYALDKNMTLNDKIAINCTTNQGPRCPIFATYISNAAYWPYWEHIRAIYSSGTWNVEKRIVA